MTTPILLSVIIPVYKAEATIEQCAFSVLEQAPQNTELLMVVDETDPSCPICEQIAKKDARARVIKNHNTGASAARNAGLNIAMGEFIQFVDADDTLAPGVYEALFPELFDGVDLAVFGVRFLSGAVWPAPNGRFANLSALPGDPADYFVKTGLLVSPVNKIYRSKLIGEHRFDPMLHINEDFLFNLEVLARCGRCFFTSEPFYVCDDRSAGSLSRSQRTDLLDVQKYIAPHLAAFLKRLCPSEQEAQNALHHWENHMALMQFSVLLGRLGPTSFAEYHRIYREIFAADEWRQQALDFVRTTYTPLPRALFTLCVRLRLAGLLALLCRVRCRLKGF